MTQALVAIDVQNPMQETILNRSPLNDDQRDAVMSTSGPVLVLAGAGTGKTRVLTTRIAYILEQGYARPHQILGVTFTNKAATEMKARVHDLVGPQSEGVWLGTFHALCVRILRRHAERIQRQPGFTILDSDDQMRLIKQLMRAEEMDEKKLPPRLVLYHISRWKDRALLPESLGLDDVSGVTLDGFSGDPVQHLYGLYQARLKILNVLDFGDIIMLCLILFQTHPDVLASYQEQFHYILVDEYQDTNVAQYLWLRLLAQKHRNLCCVGDDDQSIYGWRGAQVENILRFGKDFSGAKIIRLEENYRSTPHILGAASGLIENNQSRHGKTLWTQKDAGAKVTIKAVWDGGEEARYVAEEVEALQRAGKDLKTMAILVRASYQTREFEERFLNLGIAYQVIGGLRFYERLEIRDALAYLRVVQEPADSLAFERIMNTPRRGIGSATVQVLHQCARHEGVSLQDAAHVLVETDEITGRARKSLRDLLGDFSRWRAQSQHTTLEELAKTILDESGYTMMWLNDKSPEAPGRLENLKEFIQALRDYDTLESFLEHVSLVMDNAQSALADQDLVTIMTLHSAKGLEFDHVFLTGWEEGVFPNQRALQEGGLEEERRLAYVGLTRARERAYISHAHSRRIHGSWESGVPSRFISELPKEHIIVDDQVAVYDIPPMKSRGGFRRFDVSRGEPQRIAGARPGGAPQAGLFKLGDRIFHQKFGYGYVVGVSGDKLEIRFEHSGTKNVLANFVRPAKDV